jgi:hypothetical protein
MSRAHIYVNAALPKTYEAPQVVRRKTLDADGLRPLLLPNDAAIATAAEGTVEEKILEIFVQPEVLFGDASFIPANRHTWLEKLAHFTRRRAAIELAAMAFPYKSPNPLKSERQAPDIGEALMLRRFQAVLDAIGAVYEPGGRLTILEEGILGRCQGVDPRRIAAYRAGIDRIVRLAGIDARRILFHSLDDMVTAIPNFEARWIHEQERLRELWQQGDPSTRAAYDTTVPALRTSVPTLDYDPAVLAAAYDPGQTDSALRYVRDYVDKVAHRQLFAYLALLSLRDASGYLHNLRPHALKLTVSPKPTNLAVIPVNRWSRILPYHGVPVLRADGMWEIEYRAAAGRYGPLEALHLDDDDDPAPIGYRTAA